MIPAAIFAHCNVKLEASALGKGQPLLQVISHQFRHLLATQHGRLFSFKEFLQHVAELRSGATKQYASAGLADLQNVTQLVRLRSSEVAKREGCRVGTQIEFVRRVIRAPARRPPVLPAPDGPYPSSDEVRILRWPRARNGGPTSDTCIAMVRPTGVTRHEYPRRSLHRIGATTASGSTEVSMSESSGEVIDIERAVKARYSRAAKAPEASLCCPTSYDPTLLVSSCSGALR